MKPGSYLAVGNQFKEKLEGCLVWRGNNRIGALVVFLGCNNSQGCILARSIGELPAWIQAKRPQIVGNVATFNDPAGITFIAGEGYQFSFALSSNQNEM